MEQSKEQLSEEKTTGDGIEAVASISPQLAEATASTSEMTDATELTPEPLEATPPTPKPLEATAPTPEPLEATAPTPEPLGATAPIAPQMPEAVAPVLAPLLPAWARVLLYLAACLVAGFVGSIGAVLIGFLWLFAKHGPQAMERLNQEVGTFTITMLLVSFPLLIVTTCLFVWFIDRRSLSSVGLILTKQLWLRDFALGAAIGIGFVLASTGIYWWTGWMRFQPEPTVLTAWVFTTLIVFPLVGFTEELVFRGYLMGTLDEWSGRRTAIAISSVLFWMAHIGHALFKGSLVNELIGIPIYIAIGVTFALCRYATGNLWLPIGLHTAYNWAAISLHGDPGMGFSTLLRAQPTLANWLIGPPGQGGVIDLAFVLLLLAGIYVFLYMPSKLHPKMKMT